VCECPFPFFLSPVLISLGQGFLSTLTPLLLPLTSRETAATLSFPLPFSSPVLISLGQGFLSTLTPHLLPLTPCETAATGVQVATKLEPVEEP
jgi:hypothetical protein